MQFHATGLFRYPLKISENQRFSKAITLSFCRILRLGFSYYFMSMYIKKTRMVKIIKCLSYVYAIVK